MMQTQESHIAPERPQLALALTDVSRAIQLDCNYAKGFYFILFYFKTF